MSRPFQLVDSSQDAAMDSLASVSLEIMAERDKTEREIKRLLEEGEDKKALRLMKKHFGIRELKAVK